MKHIKKFNENIKKRIDTKAVFKDRIDWCLVNYIEYILTKYLDMGLSVLFTVEVDGFVIWQMSNEINYCDIYEEDKNVIFNTLSKEGFDYFIAISNNKLKESNGSLDEIMNKIKEKYEINIKQGYLKYSYLFKVISKN